ncbi:MAG: 3',5'-cyclic-AMP phosphodiesterase [Natronospirillum sp.]|uniref:3',5'-cyclic-AMP phosphodiesterase n=1 Tax=Natronospirillum sp. TaxID=2812955 RepID=UPI0025E08334|nr:3',5'-cyclic-AMP phosphodiesterase [Natronospirillum sp.]MCH8552288.1 3',5'-cyclic-AMP phosphodiesterase [Natronospirillum sp.]
MEQAGTPWRLVQITDPHLFGDPSRRLQGMDTRESFAAVSELVRAERSHIDLILGTGDIAQDGSEEAYQLFHDESFKLAPDMVWIPGNHDEAARMQALPFGEQCHRKIVDNEHWRIVLLDSSVPRNVHGFLEDAELEFLDEALETAGNRHILVALHHHPIPSGSAWLDNHILRNTEPFHRLISKHEEVRAVLWGHIHQHVDKVIDGVHYLATPSTCIQFAPNQFDFKLDDKPPGYRWLDLWPDGHIDTDISRVDVHIDVDLAGTGY